MTACLPLLVFGLALAYPGFSRASRVLVWVTGAYSLVVIALCAVVSVRAPPDLGPMLTGFILPRFRADWSDGMIAQHTGHDAVLLAIVLVTIAALAWVILGRRLPGEPPGDAPGRLPVDSLLGRRREPAN